MSVVFVQSNTLVVKVESNPTVVVQPINGYANKVVVDQNRPGPQGPPGTPANNALIDQAYTNAVSISTVLAGDAYTNSVIVATNLANDAYGNAVSIAVDLSNDAYSNSISVAASLANSAYTNAVLVATNLSNAAYTNSVLVATNLANAAYSNSVVLATDLANTAYSNAVLIATNLANDAYTNAVVSATILANSAYTNAITFAANASSITNGTIDNARLPSSISVSSLAVNELLVANSFAVNNSILSVGQLALSANSSLGSNGQVLTSNGAGVYWSTLGENNIVAANTDYVMTAEDDVVISTASVPITITLPDASTLKSYYFHNSGSNNSAMTIQTINSQTINGDANLTIQFNNSSCRLLSTGTSFLIF